MVWPSRTGMDRSFTLGKRASGGNGIWNAGNRTNTTKRRNHLGRTPQQQRKPERTGVYSEGTWTCFCRKISGSTNARYGESDGKNKFGNALSEFRRPENCLPRTYPLFRLLSGTESGLGTCHRPLWSRRSAISTWNDHLIYRSGSYGTTDRQPSGTNNLQRTAHLPSSGCNDSLWRRKLRNPFRGVFLAWRTEGKSRISGKADRPQPRRKNSLYRWRPLCRRSWRSHNLCVYSHQLQ